MTDHDGLYHRLYAHRTMVADLIRHLVDHPGVAELDLARMTRINSRFDGDGGARREADIIWRIPTRRGGAVYLYLMLEFQSTVDRWMAVRVMTYVGQFYLHLIREHRLGAGDRLPPVWPVVLYNGDTPWSAPTCLGDLVDLPAESPWLSIANEDDRRR